MVLTIAFPLRVSMQLFSQYIFCIIIYCDNLTSRPIRKHFFFFPVYKRLLSNFGKDYQLQRFRLLARQLRTTGTQDIFYDTNKYKSTTISANIRVSLARKLNPKLEICFYKNLVAWNINVDEQDDEGLSKWTFTLKIQK